MTDYVVVLVTCGSEAEARRIAQALVRRRLAACVNVLSPQITSIYRWMGKIDRTKETLLLIKSSAKRLAALHAAVTRLHSYSVPEFIALPVIAGSPAYLRWLGESLRAPRRPQTRKR